MEQKKMEVVKVTFADGDSLVTCGGIPEDEWNLIENRFFNLKLNDKSDKVEYALRNDKKHTVYVKTKE